MRREVDLCPPPSEGNIGVVPLSFCDFSDFVQRYFQKVEVSGPDFLMFDLQKELS